jgi:NAD(P)-dependent dehydrogenase (short-subunit alcohol dehydrogenase family)
VAGEVAVITGGSSGIGRETALLFAREGAAGVVVVDVDEEKGQETVALIRKQQGSGANAVFVKADVSKAEQVKNVSSAARLQHPRCRQ